MRDGMLLVDDGGFVPETVAVVTGTAHNDRVPASVHEAAAMPQQRFAHGALAEVEGA